MKNRTEKKKKETIKEQAPNPTTLNLLISFIYLLSFNKCTGTIGLDVQAAQQEKHSRDVTALTF